MLYLKLRYNLILRISVALSGVAGAVVCGAGGADFGFTKGVSGVIHRRDFVVGEAKPFIQAVSILVGW
jgi:hypothetical protein